MSKSLFYESMKIEFKELNELELTKRNTINIDTFHKKNVENLEKLNLSDNIISDIKPIAKSKFKKFTKDKKKNLNKNKISHPKKFKKLILGDLEKLNFGKNKIKKIVRETNHQPNYSLNYQITQPKERETQIPLGNSTPLITASHWIELINEPVKPKFSKHISLGSSKISNNSNGKISQVLIAKNKNLSKMKNNPFKLVKSIQAHDKVIVCMIELQNKLIATGSYDNTIKIWDINIQACKKECKEEGKIFSLLEIEPNIILSAVDKTPDHIQEISQIKSEDIVINCWDLKDSPHKKIFSLTGHQLRVNSLAKCNDNFFASCSNDWDIIIWDFTLQSQADKLKGHQDCVLCMIQLKNGKLCSGSADLTIKIWDWKNGNCETTLVGHNHYVKCLFQLDNGYIISGSRDKLIKIWDNYNQILGELDGHKRAVRSICQIGKTNYIASASFDHTIKIWDLNTNQCVQTLTEHQSNVINVIFHSDGYLISCSNDKTIKIWK